MLAGRLGRAPDRAGWYAWGRMVVFYGKTRKEAWEALRDYMLRMRWPV